MARFTLRVPADVDAEQAWRRLWDLDAHSAVIPLTRLTGDGTGGRPLTAGGRFVARTGLGPLAVDDVMEARVFEAPVAGRAGHAEIAKTGRVVQGRIFAEVLPTPTGSKVLWQQEIRLRPVPAVADSIVALVAKAAYGRVVRRLLVRSSPTGPAGHPRRS